MEYQKILNLLDAISGKVARFITKKWVEVHNQSVLQRIEVNQASK